MGTLNNKTLSFPGVFVKVATLFMAISLVVGCNKSGGDKGVTALVGLNGCTNCSVIATPVVIDTFQSTSSYPQAWPGTLANMQMFVDQIRYQQYPPGTTAAYNNYSGPLAVNGQFIVSGGIPMRDANGGCIINPGTYQVSTVSVGQANQGSITLPDVVANPGNIRMQMAQGVLYKNGGSAETRLYTQLKIVSVNGQVCGAFEASMQ